MKNVFLNDKGDRTFLIKVARDVKELILNQ